QPARRRRRMGHRLEPDRPVRIRPCPHRGDLPQPRRHRGTAAPGTDPARLDPSRRTHRADGTGSSGVHSAPPTAQNRGPGQRTAGSGAATRQQTRPRPSVGPATPRPGDTGSRAGTMTPRFEVAVTNGVTDSADPSVRPTNGPAYFAEPFTTGCPA